MTLATPPPAVILTWDQEWFFREDRSGDDQAYYEPTPGDLEPLPDLPTQAILGPRGPCPDDSEADSLVWTFDPAGARVLTSLAASAEKLLRGTPAHSCVFGQTPPALRGGRHDAVARLVGTLVRRLRGLSGASPALVHALAVQSVRLLEQDEDWRSKAWEMAGSFWARQPTDPALPDEATKPEAEADDAGVMTCDPEGRPHATPRNVRVALRMLGARVSYDGFADRSMVSGLPGHGPELDDAAVTRLWLACEEGLGLRMSYEKFVRVVVDLARSRARHPVREYLDSLSWDSVPRVGGWMTRYLGVPDSPYSRAVGTLFLVAAVRRVRQPGTKFDELLLLEGPQGGFKSSCLRTLAVQDSWFSDSLHLGADPKQVLEQTLGKWIIEAGDMQGMTRRTVDELKSFLSRSSDRARMAYGRLAIDRPRQFVVVGTTNSDSYLRDSTGNRRFWPVAAARVDLPALAADRDQLWAEASRMEVEGAPTRLDPSLYPAAAEQQEDRRVVDPYEEVLEQALPLTGRILSRDVWEVLGIPQDRRSQEDNGRVGQVMRRLGWSRTKIKEGSLASWAYRKGPGSSPQALRVCKMGAGKVRLVADGS